MTRRLGVAGLSLLVEGIIGAKCVGAAKGGSVANVQVLPVSSVANFQLSEGCRGAGRSGRFPRCGALVCAGEFARAFLWGVGGAFYSRQDSGSPYFGAGRPIKQMWPPRPCTAASSKGEGALATSRGEIGGRLGEAPLPGGRDGRDAREVRGVAGGGLARRSSFAFVLCLLSSSLCLLSFVFCPERG